MGRWFSRAFVKLRLVVILAWIAGTVWIAVALPSITSAGGGSLGALVPSHAPALKAEKISAQRFGFPLLSQTIVVVRNRGGLSLRRQAELTSLAQRLNRHEVPGFSQIRGALPLVNTLGAAPFSREHGTTMLLYLYFRPSVDSYMRTRAAKDLLTLKVGHQPGEFEGVTGQAPGQVAQTGIIQRYLKWVELATIALVALALALHFRAPGAAAMTVGAVAVAYLVADRLVAQFGKLGGISVPAQVQPVLVVLVFGVVTDYSVFFLSRFRTLVRQGQDRRDAAAQVSREIAPIVAVAGLTVAAGTAGLMVAHLDFLRAFGPGLAISVLIAMIVAVTLVPAALAICGRAVFWPRLAETTLEGKSARPSAVHRVRERLHGVRIAVRHPIVAVVVAVIVVLGAASGLLRTALGNEMLLGLSHGAGARQAYGQAEHGFTPGVLAPAVVVAAGPDIGAQRAKLDRLQTVLRRQPGVVQVFGPRQRPFGRAYGATISRDGGAVRYALFLGTDPMGARAIGDIRRLKNRLPGLIRSVGLSDTEALIAGDTALSADTVQDTLGDLARVTPVVLCAIFIVIALFLRALVAPAYLVLTSALAAFASLGLTVYVMQMLVGYGQITYYVVFTVAVLLVSLGSDYNVFLVGRIWQEGRRRPLREAVEVAGVRASRPIATAGLVLALSFALLALVPLRGFREIAFAMAAGLIIDAFVVRPILVPALISLVGTRSAWPSRRLRDRSRDGSRDRSRERVSPVPPSA